MKTKELTIEEKAKAYDEAIKVARKYWNSPRTCIDIDVLPELFPEIKEVDDEEIRKGLIAIITNFDSLYLQENYSLSREDAISWLEKQGEQTAEWSKEDKRNFDIIYGIIYNSCIAEDASRLNAWLLSLRPQKQWKPSLAQLNALSIVSKGCAPDDIEEIKTLYEDLKKLSKK